MQQRAQVAFYYWTTAPAVVLMVVFFMVPLAGVLWLSVSEPTLGFENYYALWDNALLHRVWMNTLRVCAVTTLISVTLGYVVAYAMARVSDQHRTLMMFCIVLTFWLSVLIRAFAWVMLLRSEGLLNSLLLWLGIVDKPLQLVRNETGVLIGMVHYMLPVAVDLHAIRRCGAEPWREVVAIVPLGVPPANEAWNRGRGHIGFHLYSRLLHHAGDPWWWTRRDDRGVPSGQLRRDAAVGLCNYAGLYAPHRTLRRPGNSGQGR